MSTEAEVSPEMAKHGKKRKKNKGSTDNNTKKRKRGEEAQEADDDEVQAMPTKKKRKRDAGEAEVEEAAEVNGYELADGVEERSKKKRKRKHEKKEGEEQPTQETAILSEPLSKEERKAEKKKRRREREAAEQAADDTGPIAQPPRKKELKHDSPQEHQKDSIPDTELSERPSKKRKKDRHKEVDQTQHLDHAPASPIPDASAHAKTSNHDGLLQKYTPFTLMTTSFYLPLSPCATYFPLQGLCAEHLSPLLLTYYAPLRGVVLGYQNVRIGDSPQPRPSPVEVEAEGETVLGKCTDEYGATFIWLTAEFLLFRPVRGSWLEGYINVQNPSFLGFLCYNYFNAAVERSKLPEDWKWVEGEVDEAMTNVSRNGRKAVEDGSGYYVDGKGERVEGRIVFRVEDFEAQPSVGMEGGSISIVGTMLPAGSGGKS